MSAIDTIRHQLVGLIAGVPLYHPLETSDRLDIGPDRLALGGGSGEHAMARISPYDAVAYFCLELTDLLTGESNGRYAPGFIEGYLQRFGWSADEVDNVIVDLVDAVSPDVEADLPDFGEWSGDEWWHFIEAAKRPGAWTRAYDPKVDRSIENWVRGVVGEFVMVSMPGLVADRVAEQRTTFEHLATFAREVPIYRGVMTFPVGYECEGGRKDRLGDGNVRH